MVKTTTTELPLPDGLDDDPALPSAMGIPLAILTGFFYAGAANLASYMAAEAEKAGAPHPPRKALAIDLGCFVAYVVGGLVITTAYASGNPVPVVNAVMVATTLLLNMVMQVGLGIVYYSKDMRVGTFIFVVTVYQLAHLGPQPRGETNLIQLFTAPMAVGWMITMVSLTVAAAVAVYSTRKTPPSNVAKVVAWSLLIGLLGSITDNAASTFGLLRGFTLAFCMFSYGIVSLCVLALSSKAPALCDAALYVPMQLCMQMVLNMITGFLVWKDDERLQASTGSYLAAFIVCLFSVYISSTDLDVMASGRVRAAGSRSPEKSQFHREMLEFISIWRYFSKPDMPFRPPANSSSSTILRGSQLLAPNLPASPEGQAKALEAAFRKVLGTGLRRGIFTQASVATLASELGGKAILTDIDGGELALTDTVPGAVKIVGWLESTPYFESFFERNPDFRDTVRSVLTSEQLAELEAACNAVANRERGTTDAAEGVELKLTSERADVPLATS